jgi:Uma2 family endonuclease
MDATTRVQPLTAEEFAVLPDDRYRYELSAGFLVSEPFPVARHDRLRKRIERALADFVLSRDLGEVFGEVGYVLARDPDTVRGPDVSFVSKARLEGFDDRRFYPGAPDLAIEVLSPSNRPGETHAKVADYLAAGAKLVWVIDTDRRQVAAYRTLLAPKPIGSGEALEAQDLIPGFALPIDDLFEGI